MKSYWIRARNGATSFELRDIPVPQPGPGELLLRVRAGALNRGELNARYQPDGEARLAGHEAAGEVVATGEGVEGVAAGSRYMGRARGGFSEYALLSVNEAIPVPDRLTWEQAAGVPLVFLIAYEMLVPYRDLQAGEWLFVTAASSGVGVASVQIGKLLGAKVIGTSGSADKLGRLETIGLDHGIRTRAPDFAARVRELTGKGANVIVNNVGGSVFAECLRALAWQGRLLTVSTMDDVTKCEIDLAELHANRWEIYGVSNRFNPPAKRAQVVRAFMREVLPAIADGRIVPVVDRVFPFDDLPAAKAYMESNAQVGKIVVRMS
jgi:NADPH:quinone reductase-like Zn-dependent oxidoreductase